MCLVHQPPCGPVLTPAISCTKFKIPSANADSPMAKTFNNLFCENFLGEPVFASQTKKLRKRLCLVDQLPIGSVLTPAISCTKFKIHSEHTDSHMAKAFNNFFPEVLLREDQSSLTRPRNSGRQCAWRTNSLVGQFLHQLSLVQS